VGETGGRDGIVGMCAAYGGVGITTAFQSAGYPSASQTRHLKQVLGAGHAAIHRIWTPNDQDVNTLLNIAEIVTADTCLHGDPVEALGEKNPPRTGRIKL